MDFVLLLNLQNLKRQDVQCGALTLKTELLDLGLLNINLSVLNTAGLGFTQKERIWQSQYISELDGPVIDTSCGFIVKTKWDMENCPNFCYHAWSSVFNTFKVLIDTILVTIPIWECNTPFKACYRVIKLNSENCAPTLQSKSCIALKGLSQVLPCQSVSGKQTTCIWNYYFYLFIFKPNLLC